MTKLKTHARTFVLVILAAAKGAGRNRVVVGSAEKR